MAEIAEPGSTVPMAPAVGRRRPPHVGELLRQTEINLRVLGMVLVLVGINVTFGIITGGRFLAPENIVALSVQAATIAIIATGMVLVIVSRNIDLSVGSIVGVVAMTYALLMTDWLPALGIGLDNPFQ